MNPYSYCLLYNFAFIGPSIVITAAILIALYLRAPMVLSVKKRRKRKGSSYVEEETTEEEEEKKPLSPTPYVVISGLAALGCFVYFLILYIKSFSHYKDGNAVGYDFDPNSMAVVVLSFFLIILAIISLAQIAKKKFNIVVHSQVTFLIVTLSLIFGISRLIRMYVKKEDPTIYWIWFGVGLFTVALFLTLTLVLYFRKKKQIEMEEIRKKQTNESSRWA